MLQMMNQLKRKSQSLCNNVHSLQYYMWKLKWVIQLEAKSNTGAMLTDRGFSIWWDVGKVHEEDENINTKDWQYTVLITFSRLEQSWTECYLTELALSKDIQCHKQHPSTTEARTTKSSQCGVASQPGDEKIATLIFPTAIFGYVWINIQT